MVVAVLVAVSLIEVLTTPDWNDGSRVLSAMGAAGCGILVLWRRHFPAAVLVGIFSIMVVTRLAGLGPDNTTGVFFAALVAGHSVGLYARGQTAVLSVGVSLGLFGVDIAISPHSAASTMSSSPS